MKPNEIFEKSSMTPNELFELAGRFVEDEATFTCERSTVKEAVGDRGQRYEVRYKDSAGNEHVLGWTTKKGGGALIEMIKKHPVWHSARIIDREEDDNK